MRRGIVLVALTVAGLSGCGDTTGEAGDPARPAASPTAPLPADGPVRAVALVLDAGGGPVLCLGGAADSLPPQCDGPEVSGWDWADHPEHESSGGARWGDFVLVGGWDGSTFTPTEARPATEEDWPRGDDGPPTTPCEEPAGGWRVVDPATTSRAARNEVGRVAEGLPDYGLLSVDQSINPRWQDYLDGDWSMEVQQALNDPALTIVNVGVTGDPAAAEPRLREVWGGPLCVYRLANTLERLREVAVELQDLPGGLGPQFGSISNRVELPVIHDDGSIQAWVDEEYGEDVVEVVSALAPAQ
jgi:hypothetical protein